MLYSVVYPETAVLLSPSRSPSRSLVLNEGLPLTNRGSMGHPQRKSGHGDAMPLQGNGRARTSEKRLEANSQEWLCQSARLHFKDQLAVLVVHSHAAELRQNILAQD